MDNRIVVIGAGPAGLGAGWRLKELGATDWNIYEKNNYVGGLSSSFKDEKNFLWDIGVHAFFSHFIYIDDLVDELLGEEYLGHRRRSFIYSFGRLIPYPFQNNIRYLPRRQARECFWSLLKASLRKKTALGNFKEWIYAIFGDAVADYFMIPQNSKSWAHPLEDMSYDWIKERVSVLSAKKILKNYLLKSKDFSWGPNSSFKYPLFNGIGDIFNRMSSHLDGHLKLNKDVVRINTKNRYIQFSDGEKTSYDYLINTMPLNRFIECSDLVDLYPTLKHLRYNSVFAVGIGMNIPFDSDKTWVYFPVDFTPFYRMTYFHNLSSYNVPTQACSSLLCETSYSVHRPYLKEKIIDDTINGLIGAGILNNDNKRNIVSTYLLNREFAYPVPTIYRDVSLEAIQNVLEKNNVYTRGRFGAWKYENGNMDYCMMQGVEVASRLLGADIPK